MMIDRKEMIKELEACLSSPCRGKIEYCSIPEKIWHVLDDVLPLLKEQEPILLENQHKPYGINTNANSPWISRCPRCGKKVEGKQTRFCKYCGQAVKWDD